MNAMKQLKHKRCKAVDSEGERCSVMFVPRYSTIGHCSPLCGLNILAAQKAKKARKEYREAKVKAKTLRDWMKEAQAAFNAFIRCRDANLPCVSCGRHHQGQYHAGHYMPTSTRPSLRFHELNVWKQCSACNNHKHGNLVHYRVELIKRIGVDIVNWLEGEHEPAKYTIEDLQEIKSIYSRKAREVVKGGQVAVTINL